MAKSARRVERKRDPPYGICHFGVAGRVGVLRRDPVAAGLGLAGQRDVALEHLVGVAANLDVRAVAVEGLRAMRRSRAPRAAATAATTAAAVMRHAAVAPARSLVLSWPHHTCLIVAMDT